jgi:hypothetical protein
MTINDLIDNAKQATPTATGDRKSEVVLGNGDMIYCLLTSAGSRNSFSAWGRMEFWTVKAGEQYRTRYSKAKATEALKYQ